MAGFALRNFLNLVNALMLNKLMQQSDHILFRGDISAYTRAQVLLLVLQLVLW